MVDLSEMATWYICTYVCILYPTCIMTGLVKINHVSTRIVVNFSSLLYHNLITIIIYIDTNVTKCLLHTNAEFNGLSSAIYRNRILQSHLKISVKM